MPKIGLMLRDEVGAAGEEVFGDFTDEDVRRLRAFVKQMSRVRTSPLLEKGLVGMSNISFDTSQGLKFTAPPYENSDLHALLHVLRPVILHEEPASFNQITSLLKQRFGSRKFSDHIKYIRSIFEDGELKGYVQITLGDQPLFDNSVLALWLNAEQYHTDEDKAAAWSALEAKLTTENARALVITRLQGKVKALMHLEYIVNLILEKCSDV